MDRPNKPRGIQNYTVVNKTGDLESDCFTADESNLLGGNRRDQQFVKLAGKQLSRDLGRRTSTYNYLYKTISIRLPTGVTITLNLVVLLL